MKRLLLLSFLLSVAVGSFAQTPRDLSVELEAVVDGGTFVISWPEDARATNYHVHRRVAGIVKWDTLTKTLGKTASSYTDTTLSAGKLYEYRIKKTLTVGSSIPAWGYIYGGIAIEHPVAQGTVILVVDDTFATDLATELLRLEDDLLNEGWQVHRIDAKRYGTPPQVKESIMDAYSQDPDNIKAVFLFGHVPVPYSGLYVVPDGHPDHMGAWPADVYYGEVHGEWTDDYSQSEIVINGVPIDTNTIRKPNRNSVSDGKFDQVTIPDNVDLMVGRVDLANMPEFPKSEQELLRQYLDKDHAYRTGQLTAPPRALIDDNFGTFSVNESFASSAWRAFPQLVGRDSIHDNSSVDWFTTLPKQPYLWAYGCGGGSFTSCGGVGTTKDFDTLGSKAIFTMLFGSYFGDWNVQDNFLRAPLATEYGLSCAWSGRPYWYFQPMAIGLPIGFCARLTQNNVGAYVTGPSPTSIHIALMGDPTLKMNVIAPPKNAVATNEGFNRVRLSWTISPDPSIAGYNIYKAHKPQGPYYLSNLTPVSGVSEYMDTVPFSGKNVYMIHAARNEVTAAGTYLNLSPAARVTIEGIVSGVASADQEAASPLSARQTSAGTELTLQVSASDDVHIALYNYLGEQVKVFDDRPLTAGMHTYQWTSLERDAVAQGIYFAVARIGEKVHQVKVLNLR